MINIILDFDGTLTDTENEARPFLKKWNELFSEKTGVPVKCLENSIAEAKAAILSDTKKGWMNNGYVAAPATADPYILNSTIFQYLSEKFRNEGKYDIPKDDNYLQDLFIQAYPYSTISFRKGAKELLGSLVQKYNVNIVTNSKAGLVKKKITKLGNYDIPVIGDAKKYVIFGSESIILEGFPRQVFLGRDNYRKILDKFIPEETLVIGDIYELDLALPEYLGFHTCLIGTSSTPFYEIMHQSRIPKGYYAADCEEFIKAVLPILH